MGDGINDAGALREADVGISVDTAVDIAKESADIILLEKSLMVLEEGVIEGRKTFGNIIKYIKMTASSNFGNVFSVLVASAFLPFLPMLPMQLLTQNLLYDFSQTTIPWDNLDPDYLDVPRKWNADDIGRFMLFIGPISSVFDITTFAILWYVFGANNVEPRIAVPGRLVHRGVALADADRAHDPHGEDPVHPEPRLVAGANHHCHGDPRRRRDAVLPLRRERRHAPAALDLLSVPRARAAQLHAAHAGGEGVVHPEVRGLALSGACAGSPLGVRPVRWALNCSWG